MINRRVWLTALLASISVIVVSCSKKPFAPTPARYSSIRIIRDYQYLDNTYFSLTRTDSLLSPADLQPGDSITLLHLYYYVPGHDNPAGAINCKLCVDPFDTLKYPYESLQGHFQLYSDSRDGATYMLYRNQFYLILDTPVPPGIALGIYMEYRHPNGDGTFSNIVVGDITSDPHRYLLKTILTGNSQPKYVTWNYVWRNVYSFGGPIGDSSRLLVKIYRGNATSISDMDASDLDHLVTGQSYIDLFRLDRNNDGRVDFSNDEVFDASHGYLLFPSTRPFADSNILPDSSQVKTLYNDNNWTNRAQDSKYYIFVGLLR